MAPTTGTGGGQPNSNYPTLGPAYLGEEEYEKQLEKARVSGGGVLGPAFQDNENVNRPASAGKHKIVDREAVISLSVKDLEEKLEIDPGLTGSLFAAELERPNGPRKRALTSLIFVESTKKRPDDELLERMRKAAGIETTEPGEDAEPEPEGEDTLEDLVDTPPMALDVNVSDLEGFLADVDDAELIEAWAEADERTTAGPIYEARLAELTEPDEGEEE